MAKIDKRPQAGSQRPGQADKAKAEGHKEKGKKDAPKGKDAPPSIGWRADFEAADANKDGKLGKSELKLSKEDRKVYDGDSNGKVTRREYRAGERQANSFAGLDRDGDGALSKKEMAKLKRFTDTNYDGDGDGSVSETEFVENRRVERGAMREARHDAAFEALSAKDKKALKHYDSDQDGKISREEFGDGVLQDRAARADQKIAALFKQAGGKDGQLTGDGAKAYKTYDADGDGAVSKEEFSAGQKADRREYWTQSLQQGGVSKLLARRLDLNEAGFGLDKLNGGASPMPGGPTEANGATDFVISSFNVLSSNAGRGKGFANPMARMKWTTEILDQHNVSVVGFQEMDANQLKEFKKLAGDKYGTFAGSSGKKGYHDTTLAWHKDTWDMVKGDHITVPSYAGRASKVPYVLLRNKQTGQEAYFVDVHNPANTKNYHHQERFRNEAARREAALVKRLMERSGKPVFMVGDFNSVEPARDIVTKGADVTAANAQTGKRPGIDWIFGSKGVKFTRFLRTREGQIGKTTDHPVLFSKVHIGKNR